MIEILAIFAAGFLAARQWPWYTPFALFAIAAPFTILKTYLRNVARAEEGLSPVEWSETALVLAVMLAVMLALFFGARWFSGQRRGGRTGH